TLHAPGQLVSYPIVRIPRRDLGGYVHNLEEVLVRLLADLGVLAERRRGRPGLYVEGRKIASVGLRCQQWVASHGTSLNVNVDLGLFVHIVSCGEPELEQTSLEQLTGRTFPMEDIKRRYREALADVFGWDLGPITAVELVEVERYLGLPART
ncbi:MAG: lipoyl(octanoyl) transferase LipB, partial [Thermoleophilia bacterium]|nr:lipoyl(octanoyl) transferase LipB [Thermoleophilia bacterium]